MKVWKLNHGIEIHQVLSGRSNSYLLITNEQCILIDTGVNKSFHTLKKNIEKVNKQHKPISFLILTHTHFDHCQSVNELKATYNCKVIVSKEAQASIKNGYTVLPKGTLFFTKIISKLGHIIKSKRIRYKPFCVDIFIEKEYAIRSNDMNLEIIKTDGHSKDSMSIIVNNEIGIVGDTLFGVFSNRVFPPFADDIKKLIHSWKKLLQTKCNVFLPGHGQEIRRNTLKKELNKYVKKYSFEF